MISDRYLEYLYQLTSTTAGYIDNYIENLKEYVDKIEIEQVFNNYDLRIRKTIKRIIITILDKFKIYIRASPFNLILIII